eukprot:gene21209-29130_t
MLGLKLAATSPGGCAQPPLYAVALGRIADFFRHGEADARFGLLYGNDLQRKTSPSGPEPARSIKELRPLAEAESFLRPMARRRLRILRPFLVAMRARKPWRRVRTRTLGWKVRFIVSHHAGRGPLKSELALDRAAAAKPANAD